MSNVRFGARALARVFLPLLLAVSVIAPAMVNTTNKASAASALHYLFGSGSATGGKTVHFRIELTEPAPAGGAVVTMSANPPLINVPAQVTVNAGQTEREFGVSTTPVFVTTPVTVTASYGGVTKTRVVTIIEPRLSSLSVQTRMRAGGAGKIIARLSGRAPVGGIDVNVTSNNTAVVASPGVQHVAAGAASVTIIVNPSFQTQDVPVDFTATYDGNTITRSTIVRYYPTADDLTATAEASATEAANQTATANANASATESANQTATADANASATEAANQTATEAANQTATAVSNEATQTVIADEITQTAVAAENSATAAANQTAAAATQTAISDESTATAAANETATEEANQTATADANASATEAANQTATADANASATEAANQTATAAANETATQIANETTATAISDETTATAVSDEATATQVAADTTATAISDETTATAVSDEATATQVSSDTTATAVSDEATATQVSVDATSTAAAIQTATQAAVETATAAANATGTAAANATATSVAATATAAANATATAQALPCTPNGNGWCVVRTDNNGNIQDGENASFQVCRANAGSSTTVYLRSTNTDAGRVSGGQNSSLSFLAGTYCRNASMYSQFDDDESGYAQLQVRTSSSGGSTLASSDSVYFVN